MTFINGPSFGSAPPNGGAGTTIWGWAANLDRRASTGIDTVHVWALNLLSGAAVFLGADYGRPRPDVASYFNTPAYSASGFQITMQQALPPGPYYLVAYAHNAAGGFNYGTPWFVVIR